MKKIFPVLIAGTLALLPQFGRGEDPVFWGGFDFQNLTSDLYVSIEGGVSLYDLSSGGFNTFGAVPNTGDDSGMGKSVAVHVGKRFDKLRIEIGGTYRDGINAVTQGFPPPGGPFDVFTDSDIWTVDSSFYYDIFEWDKTKLFVGGGVGAAFVEMNGTDSAWTTRDHDETNFFWQVGAGIEHQISDTTSVLLTYRLVNFGETQMPLLFPAPGGNFTADIYAHEISAGFLFHF